MHPVTIIEATAAILTLLGGMAAYIRSSGNREGRMTSALEESARRHDETAKRITEVVEANARTNDKLSDVLDRLGDNFIGLDRRVTVVETKIKGM